MLAAKTLLLVVASALAISSSSAAKQFPSTLGLNRFEQPFKVRERERERVSLCEKKYICRSKPNPPPSSSSPCLAADP